VNLNLAKDIIVFVVVCLPPLLILWKVFREKGTNKFLLLFLGLIYVAISLFTQNFLPFIATTICIVSFRRSEIYYKDYRKYSFSLRGFNLFKGLKYAMLSYIIVIILGAVGMQVFNYFKLPVKEQEIVSIMVNVPLKTFIILIPVTVIFAPIVEEFVFRWLFFERICKRRIGVILGAIITSLMFSATHFNLKSSFVIFGIGLFNCYLIHKKGYWYSVFNHMVFNSVSTFLILFQKLGYINLG